MRLGNSAAFFSIKILYNLSFCVSCFFFLWKLFKRLKEFYDILRNFKTFKASEYYPELGNSFISIDFFFTFSCCLNLSERNFPRFSSHYFKIIPTKKNTYFSSLSLTILRNLFSRNGSREKCATSLN